MEVSGQLHAQGKSPWYPLDRRRINELFHVTEAQKRKTDYAITQLSSDNGSIPDITIVIHYLNLKLLELTLRIQ
jgi:hypothetical protein